MRKYSFGVFFTVLTLSIGLYHQAFAQEIQKKDYIDFLPLHYMKLMQEIDATVKFKLYGDENDPAYRDDNPVDGIDDRRHKILKKIAMRFAPFMVQNSIMAPMSIEYFIDTQASFPLYVDTWDLTGEKSEIINSETINTVTLGKSECSTDMFTDWLADSLSDSSTFFQNPENLNVALNDCKMLALLKEFYPYNPKDNFLKKSLIRQNPNLFKVLYFDLPGHDPQSWKDHYKHEFTKNLSSEFKDYIKVHVHPLIEEVRSNVTNEVLGYEFVLQNWFYYFINDGGNNHEGDWEHINVIISPKNKVNEYLSSEDINNILNGKGLESTDNEDDLVIKRVEYYFHHFVMELDYAKPNVYLPREAWRKELRTIAQDRTNEREIWKAIRYYAYVDNEESEINTHPIGYIGADNKGFDQVLSVPGDKNRDSHGNYPFAGIYKNIGPAGATEQISTYFDHRKFIKELRENGGEKQPVEYKRGHIIPFDHPDRIEIVPDWERVLNLAHTNPEVRRRWFWLLLPIHWGYPASVSPLAGIVKNADTGNVGPNGPSFNLAWNRVGSTANYHFYKPHQLPDIFPLGMQDNFQNNLGFLNLTYPVLLNLPPSDFLWRLVAYPVRALTKRQQPVFYPNESIPFRFIGFSAGTSIQKLNEEFTALTINPDQFDEFIGKFLSHFIEKGADTTTTATFTDLNENMNAPLYQVVFFIGDRFTSENTLRHSRSRIGFRASFSNIPDYTYTSSLNFWEYAGSLRYNLKTSNIKPFIKMGYGLSWYRLENAMANGQLFDIPNSPWIRKPSLSSLKNILPNTWHIGNGLEWVILKSFAKFPKGVDLSVRAEYTLFYNKLGLDLSSIDLNRLGIVFSRLGDVPNGRSVTRHNFNFGLTLSF